MIKEDENILIKWQEITNNYIDKEVKLEAYIQKWLNGEIDLSSSTIQGLIETTTNQIEKLKAEANMLLENHINIKKDRMLAKEGLVSVKNNDTITSENVNEPQSIEEKRKYDFAKIRRSILNNKITLTDALNIKTTLDGEYIENKDIEENINRK